MMEKSAMTPQSNYRLRDLWRDVLAFGGIGLVGSGLWLIHPAAALSVIGALMIYLGVWRK